MSAERESEECDLLIVIGSSLVVYPAAYMPLYAKRSGAKIVIINMGDTGHDDIADVFINAPAGRDQNDEKIHGSRLKFCFPLF